MSNARRTVSLILASILTFAGAAGAVWFLFLTPIYSIWLTGGAGLVWAVGAMWLYSDFIGDEDRHQRNSRWGRERPYVHAAMERDRLD
jgi:hypothetical protein